MNRPSKLPQRKVVRLPGYDYSQEGWYYVTICTEGRNCLFGDIRSSTVCLNLIGKMVEKWWLDLPNKFYGVSLDVYTIMPNHLHGIVCINDQIVGAGSSRPVTLGQILASFKYESTREFNDTHRGRENRATSNTSFATKKPYIKFGNT